MCVFLETLGVLIAMEDWESSKILLPTGKTAKVQQCTLTCITLSA